MTTISYSPIGVIRSPFKETEGMPIQAKAAAGIPGRVELDSKFAPGIRDLDGFSFIILFYHFHLSAGYSLEVTPFLDDRAHGVFATRAPRRPNPIGISTVRLTGIEGCTLFIEDVDVIDGTPLLDIKPYVPEFDSRCAEKIGWLQGKADRAANTKSDKRFR